jgi:hypothetical protein
MNNVQELSKFVNISSLHIFRTSFMFTIFFPRRDDLEKLGWIHLDGWTLAILRMNKRRDNSTEMRGIVRINTVGTLRRK